MAINKYYNFGGPTLGNYIGTVFPGSTDYSFSDGSNIDLSNTNYPLLPARFGTLVYSYGTPVFTASGLTPNAPYQVILDFCTPGPKSFFIDINGINVIADYAPISTAAGNLKAYSPVFNVVSNSAGQITLAIRAHDTDAIINAAAFLEILTDAAGAGRNYPV